METEQARNRQCFAGVILYRGTEDKNYRAGETGIQDALNQTGGFGGAGRDTGNHGDLFRGYRGKGTMQKVGADEKGALKKLRKGAGQG